MTAAELLERHTPQAKEILPLPTTTFSKPTFAKLPLAVPTLAMRDLKRLILAAPTCLGIKKVLISCGDSCHELFSIWK